MLSRLALDIIAVSASALAVVFASFQVKDGQLSRLVLWLALMLLLAVATTATVDLVHSIPIEWSELVSPETIRAGVA